eukprot:2190847-Pleurochrysis_carterae.AAC.2
MDAPVHRFRKLAHAALRKVARETLAFELRVLTPQPGGESGLSARAGKHGKMQSTQKTYSKRYQSSTCEAPLTPLQSSCNAHSLYVARASWPNTKLSAGASIAPHRSRLWAHSELLALPKVLADNVVGARGVGGFARLQRAARRVRGQRAVRRMQRVRRVRAMRRVRHVERARGLHHPIGLLHPAARRLALALQRAAHGSIAAVKKR